MGQTTRGATAAMVVFMVVGAVSTALSVVEMAALEAAVVEPVTALILLTCNVVGAGGIAMLVSAAIAMLVSVMAATGA
jgi:hypothetical protein